MTNSTSWTDFRLLFPITSTLAYLNSAAMGPLPIPVRRALVSHMDAWEREDLGTRIGIDFSESLRGRVASFLGTSVDRIAFTSGATGSLFRAASLVRPARGENVVVPANEFPSAVYPWRRYQAEGVELRFAGSPTGPVTEADLAGACDERTRAVCASLVSFADGTFLDIAFLSRFTRRRGIALVVDAMQAAGAVKIDLAATPVDFLAFGPVKWIPSPVGAGVLYVAPAWERRAEGRWLGWRSVQRDDLRDLLRYDLEPCAGARRLDGGSPAFMCHVGLEAALELLMEAGVDRIEERVRHLAAEVVGLLREEGFDRVSPETESRRAGIVVCEAPDASRLVDALADDGIIIAERNGRIRVSAHAFNDEEDLQRLREGLRARGGRVR